MSSFKFRIWDNIDKHMYYMPAADQPLGDRFEVSFFTGLLDCEGLEIWEGDIVEFFESRLTVEIHRGAFGIRGERSIFYFCNLDGVEKCFRVIGNRFANPELLEVKNGNCA